MTFYVSSATETEINLAFLLMCKLIIARSIMIQVFLKTKYKWKQRVFKLNAALILKLVLL